MYLTFSPPNVAGSSAKVCFSGIPSEAAGPVAETMTPMVTSARADPVAKTSAIAWASASFFNFMMSPVVNNWYFGELWL